jgi:DNA-binding response OmpR family regulator
MTINKVDKQKILIVDDEPDIITSLKMYLESQGFQIDGFANPEKCTSTF